MSFKAILLETRQFLSLDLFFNLLEEMLWILFQSFLYKNILFTYKDLILTE